MQRLLAFIFTGSLFVGSCAMAYIEPLGPYWEFYAVCIGTFGAVFLLTFRVFPRVR